MVTDAELEDALKAKGWLTIEEQLKPQPIDAFMAHVGVTDYAKLREWADMKFREQLRYKALYDLGIWEDSVNEEYHLGKLVMIRELVANLRQIENGN